MRIFRLNSTQECSFHDRRARMNTDIVARMLCAAFTLYPPFSGLTMPGSVSGLMQFFDVEFSAVLFVSMALIALLIFVDVVFNSLLRGAPRIPWLALHRDWLYLSAAFCAVVVPFSVSKSMEVDAGANYLYVVIFLGSIALSWCDAHAKRNTVSRKVRCEKTL